MSAILITIALLAVVLLSGPVVAQDIYKTVDEHGNVVYTDRKPSDDAEPLKLPELTIVDPIDLGNSDAVSADEQAESEADNAAATGPNVRIVSPQADETIWNTGYTLSVEIAFDGSVPANAEVVYMIDGEIKQRSRQATASLEEIYRGPHTLTVELRAASGAVIASDSVPFFM
ncbi:MAG: DUF4124 domain-containing protein, partial [Wenzhouxiangellaceae bacterium]